MAINRTKLALFLLAIILIEGYVVLAAELLAMRQLTPFVGNATDTVSIIIAAVLMPLAFGYNSGGNFKPGLRNGTYYSVREKLKFNFFVSLCFLAVGSSYVFLNIFFFSFYGAGLTNRLVLTTIYSVLFLVLPVYLLGQTIPLIGHYFRNQQLSRATGYMLFFSTLGSFMGAVFSTLFLMSTIGVHNSATFLIFCLGLLIFLLQKRKFTELNIIVALIIGAAAYTNSSSMMASFDIVENNQYNTVMAFEDEEGRHLFLNNNSSSSIYNDGKPHDYVAMAESLTIKNVPDNKKPLEILVIGAGGFTFGLDDKDNNFDFIDIDPSLKRLSEEYLLNEPLGSNKNFITMPARGFLSSTDKKYDVIFLDAYTGDLTLPEHLVTREFFLQIKEKLTDDGIVVANFILSPTFKTPISQKIDTTFQSVFPKTSRHIVSESLPNVWSNDSAYTENVIYFYKNRDNFNLKDIYTDNKNTVFMDKPQRKFLPEAP